MKLRNKIGAAMAAVTLAGVAVTGLLTWVRLNQAIEEGSQRQVVEAANTLAIEWRNLDNDLTGNLSRVVQGRQFQKSLGRLSQGIISPGSWEITSLAERSIKRPELSYLQLFDDSGHALSTEGRRIPGGHKDPEGWEVVRRSFPEAVVNRRTRQGRSELTLETSISLELNDRKFHVVGGRLITPEMVEQLTRRAGGIGYVQMYESYDSTAVLPQGVKAEKLTHLGGSRQQFAGGHSFVVGELARDKTTVTTVTTKICQVAIKGVDGTVQGNTVLKLSQVPLAKLVQELSWDFLSVATIGLVLAWAVGFLFARRITRPVEQLALVARRVGVGRAPGAMPAVTDDEVGDLVRSFQRMTADLSESRLELVRAERLAAWRDIAQRMAHEIKNALSPIQISVETIQRNHQSGHPDMNAIVDESVEIVRTEVRGLRNLVNEFSQFARMPGLELSAGSVNLPVERAANLHDRNERGIRVETILSDALPDIQLDADALSRAVGNLILNAVEATPEGGRVLVSTAPAGVGGVEIVVDDQGSGIAPGDRERIFEPYFTTKPGGTGLGLAMAWKIISEHSGRVEIQDAPGGGARFRVVLPVRDAGLAPRSDSSPGTADGVDRWIVHPEGSPSPADAGAVR